ncbi:trypsin-like serine protease [Planctomycetota bacterium]
MLCRTIHPFETLERRQLLASDPVLGDVFFDDVLLDVPEKGNGATVDADVERPIAKIIGGKAAEDDWPMMVSLSNNGGHLCGGTLVDFDIVVTAAHCLDGTPISSLRAILGRKDLRTNVGESISIAEAIVHPGYRKLAFNDDIAMLRLSRPSGYEPVDIVRSETASLAAPETIAIALGWGALDDGIQPEFPSKLHRVDVPVVSNEVANRPLGYDGKVTDDMLAAGSPGKDTCGGDSGGPLLVKDTGGEFYLAGITSFGSEEGCGQANLPGIYTRVSSYDRWLDPFLPASTAGRIGFNSVEYKASEKVTITLRDSDLIGNGTQSVTLTSDQGDAETLLLSESNHGVFTGDIRLSLQTVVVSNGTLEVDEKGTISVVYQDEEHLDGLPSSVAANATIFGDDHGNSLKDSTAISLDESIRGELELPGDVDWFSVELTAGVNYEMATTLHSLDDTILTIFDRDGVKIASNDDAGGTAASKIRWEPALDGIYFVEVKGYTDAQGSYSFWAGETVAIDDHGNGPLSSTLVASGSSEGTIEVDFDRDWFRFNAISGVEYVIETETIGLIDSFLRLIDTDGVSELESNDDIPNGLSSRIDWTATTSGMFFFEVTGWSGDHGSYGIHFSEIIHEDDLEPNDAQNRATIWPIETPLEGLSIDTPADVDWFQWIPPVADAYALDIAVEEGVVLPSVQILDASGTVLAESSSENPQSSFPFGAPADLPIFVRVASQGDSTVARYGLTIDRRLPNMIGDFTRDQRVDMQDVDLLCANIRSEAAELTFDLNSDGIVDEADLDYLLEDLLDTVFGDVNGDGRFDSSDFVVVFTAAEYEDETAGNSNWTSGDWNCDGDFDSRDFVVAFQRATYSGSVPPMKRLAVGELWHDRDDQRTRMR